MSSRRHVMGRPHVALILLLTGLMSMVPAWAADDQPKAKTTGDPEMALDVLALRCKPLTKSELKVEADAWMQLLKAKVKQVCDAEIASRLKREEVKRAEETASKAAEAKEALEKADAVTTENGEAADQARQEAKKKAEEAKKAAEEAEKAAEKSKQAGDVSDAEKAAIDAAKKKDAGDDQPDEPDADTGDGGSGDETGAQAKADAAKAAAEAAQGTGDTEEDKKKLEEAAAKAKQAAEQKAEVRTQILAGLAELRDEQTELIDRVNVVLDAWEAKGGDPAEYRQYVSAVSGLTVDVTDAEATWATIKGWLTSDQGGLRWGKNILMFVLTLLAFWILSLIVAALVSRGVARMKKLSELMREFLTNTARRLTLVIGLIVAMATLEVHIGPLLAVIGAAGFVVAFALQGTLSNLASGLMILFNRPFDVGDVVDVAGVGGTVATTGLMTTTINTFDNKTVIVPNNSIWGDVITNATSPSQRRVDLKFGVSYSDDLGKVIEILKRVVGTHELVLDEPATNIQVHELGDSSVNLICRPWVRTSDYWTVYWDLMRKVKEEFDANDITIPFPQRDVHMFPQPVPATDSHNDSKPNASSVSGTDFPE